MRVEAHARPELGVLDGGEIPRMSMPGQRVRDGGVVDADEGVAGVEEDGARRPGR
jgi:hypothetical protein